MTKNQRKRKQISFSNRRYPKPSKAEAEKMRLPDEVFWPVYYGMYKGGICAQLTPRFRWHVIKCIEDGFKDNDEGLLQARRELVGLLYMTEAFQQKHKAVLESPTFLETKKWMEQERVDPFALEKRCETSEWETRAYLASWEFESYMSNQMKEFYKAMGFSAPHPADKYRMAPIASEEEPASWQHLVNGSIADTSQWKPLHRGPLKGLDFDTALALVNERTESEDHEIDALERSRNNQSFMDFKWKCRQAFLSVLARDRAAYVEKTPNRDEEEKEHTNFGLDIDVPSLPTRVKKSKMLNGSLAKRIRVSGVGSSL